MKLNREHKENIALASLALLSVGLIWVIGWLGVILPALYHWSPKERRTEIEAHGLHPRKAATTHSDPDLLSPYLCFSPTPSAAWSLSGAMEWTSEVDGWDLWQVRIAEGDSICIRPDFGPVIQEIKVYNAILPDRLWHVGERGVPVFEPAQP